MTNLDPTAPSFAGAEPALTRDLRRAAERAWRLTSGDDRMPLPPMPLSKRLLDLTVAVLLLLLLWPILLIVAGLLLLKEGRPIFYVGERMSAPGRPFRQYKFRTMRVGSD